MRALAWISRRHDPCDYASATTNELRIRRHRLPNGIANYQLVGFEFEFFVSWARSWLISWLMMLPVVVILVSPVTMDSRYEGVPFGGRVTIRANLPWRGTGRLFGGVARGGGG